MPVNPTVTIQIVTYNSANDIEECLNAVLQLSYPIKEIIIIDNASTDGTVDRIRAYVEQSNANNVWVVPNPTNTGFAPAHNQGIRMTQSDYVLVLNPDVQLGAEYVERLVEVMEQRSEVGSATGLLVLKSSPDIVDSTGLSMSGIWRAVDRGAGESASQWRESGEVFGVSGAAAMYRRVMIDELSIAGEFLMRTFSPIKRMWMWPGGLVYLAGKLIIVRRPWPFMREAGRRAVAIRSL